MPFKSHLQLVHSAVTLPVKDGTNHSRGFAIYTHLFK